MTTTAEKVREVVERALVVDASRVTDTAILRIPEDGEDTTNRLNADSLDMVEIVLELEEEFGIEIADDEADKMVTVADVTALVDRLIAEKAHA